MKPEFSTRQGVETKGRRQQQQQKKKHTHTQTRRSWGTKNKGYLHNYKHNSSPRPKQIETLIRKERLFNAYGFMYPLKFIIFSMIMRSRVV